MKLYEIRAWVSFLFGMSLLGMGTYIVTDTNNHQQTVNFGFVIVTIGAIFVSTTVAIKLSAQTTEELTENIINKMILEGIISSDSKLNLDKKMLVKPVTRTFTYKYSIENPYWKAAI